MTNSQSLIQQAQKGNIQAIATLLRSKLQPKGITVKVASKNNYVSVMLEASNTPPQQPLVQFIKQVFTKLNVTVWQTVKVYGRKIGEDCPDWSEDFQIIDKPIQSPELLAKQGDITAIALLLNQQLKSRNIVAKINIKNDCLQALLESIELPDQQQMVSLLKTEILKLEIPSVTRLKLYGKQADEDFPDWHVEISLIVEESIETKSLSSSTQIDGTALSNQIYIVLQEACSNQLYHRISLEEDEDQTIHEMIEAFIDGLESDLKSDLAQFSIQVYRIINYFDLHLSLNQIQDLVSEIEITKFTGVKSAIRELEKASQKLFQIDFPKDDDQTAFFRGAVRGAVQELTAQFSGYTTMSREAIIGTTIGTFIAPGLGTIIGGAIGGWFGGERQQQEIQTLIEKYEKARSKLFVEWELLVKAIYNKLTDLIARIDSVELLSYEVIDRAGDFYSKGNDYLNSEEDLEKALECYDQAITLNPGFASAWVNKSYIFNQLEQYDEALEAAEQAIKYDNTSPIAFNNYGDALQGLERYEEALMSYEQSLKLEPENGISLIGKFYCLYNLQCYEQAIENCNQLIHLSQDNYFLWCLKAACQIQLCNTDQALGSLTKAIKLNPAEAQSFINETSDFDVLRENEPYEFQKLIGQVSESNLEQEDTFSKVAIEARHISTRTELNQGEQINLSKQRPEIKQLQIELNWGIDQTNINAIYDLDTFVFTLGVNGKTSSEQYFTFYNSLQSPSGSVKLLSVNCDAGRQGDNEIIKVDLTKINSSIQELVFLVTLYETKQRRQGLDQICNTFISIYNEATKQDIVKHDLKENFYRETVVETFKLYKNGEDWCFQSLGQETNSSEVLKESLRQKKWGQKVVFYPLIIKK